MLLWVLQSFYRSHINPQCIQNPNCSFSEVICFLTWGKLPLWTKLPYLLPPVCPIYTRSFYQMGLGDAALRLMGTKGGRIETVEPLVPLAFHCLFYLTA